MKPPEEVLMDCAKGLGQEVWGLCSGGKDSMTACYIAHKYRPLNGIVTVDTTIGVFKVVNGKKIYVALEAAKKFADLLGIQHIIIKPKKSFKEYVQKYGMPHPGQHNAVYRELKWKPMVKFVRSRKGPKGEYYDVVFISGVRILESKKRFISAKPTQVDPTVKRMRFVAPIIYWDTETVIKFIQEKQFPKSDSYNTLHLSGDCLCGAYAEKGESELISLFYPECGRYIAECEKQANKDHKGKNGWGNNTPMIHALEQTDLEDFICADCSTGRINGGEN